MTDSGFSQLRLWQEATRALYDKIRQTPLDEWHQHPDIMDKVRREGFDIEAAMVRMELRSRKEADNA